VGGRAQAGPTCLLGLSECGQQPPLVLRDLEYLKEYDGSRYQDLPGRLQTRLEETELVVHLIRQGTPEKVMFNIFVRINTGGLPLSRQELEEQHAEARNHKRYGVPGNWMNWGA
jgi:hypothetical protein